MKNVTVALWLGIVAIAVAGCQSTSPKPRTLDLIINKTTPASIRVDLICVTEMEQHAWEGYDVDQYWTEGDSRRANADKLTVNLPTGQPWVLRRDDPQWQHWISSGATTLLIMADLPGVFTPGPTDPRRTFVPLIKVWDAKSPTLEIEVQDTIVQPRWLNQSGTR